MEAVRVREHESCCRVEFLWDVVHRYSAKCPQLAAYWGDWHPVSPLPAPPATLKERLCPGCGSLLLPSLPPSSLPLLPSPQVRTVSLQKLKAIRRRSHGRKGVWLNNPLGKARAYVMVNCTCGGSYVVATLARPLEGRRPHPPDVTPKCTRRGRRPKTLKRMLAESSQQETQRQQQAASPSLSLFLTSLNT